MDAPPVQYVTTSDGFNVAYTVSGAGIPFVFTPSALSHVQLLWEIPTSGDWLRGLSRRFRLVQYDGRGQGLSTRGLGGGFTVGDRERDLAAVVDKLDLQDFILMGTGHVAHTAVRYAIKNAHRVKAVILLHASPTMLNAPFNLDLARYDWPLFLNSLASVR
jgi:pimeloyl-ACP methyl ester carboxylesterase